MATEAPTPTPQLPVQPEASLGTVGLDNAMLQLLTDMSKLVQNQQKRIDELETAQKQFASDVNVGFEESKANFIKIRDILSTLPTGRETVVNPAGQPQQQEGGFMGLVNNILKAINEGKFTPSGGSLPPELVQMDRDIAIMGRQLISLTYKKALKEMAGTAGLPELATHVEVSP
jgi:hypothetical protein